MRTRETDVIYLATVLVGCGVADIARGFDRARGRDCNPRDASVFAAIPRQTS